MKWREGQRVRYWKGRMVGPPSGVGFITSVGLVGNHAPVVWISGCSGCIAQTHLELVRLSETRSWGRRYEIVGQAWPGIGNKDNLAESCLGYETSFLSARAKLRLAVRSEVYSFAWIVDHTTGLRHDLKGVVTFESG